MSRHVDALVVGSGPGGAVTARALAEAGLETLVIEEGDWVEPGAVEPYSVEQMQRQYRNSGLTVALGMPSIAYTEGCGAGGGSEVNSGLYHRPSAELLQEWSSRYGIDGLDAETLAPHH
ncbi:MAG: GMC family oxidoreductase, partial [Nocardioidaceae bacterium]|nr:GMC family oxidoreductase [Nocardioidaceae bacterium]